MIPQVRPHSCGLQRAEVVAVGRYNDDGRPAPLAFRDADDLRDVNGSVTTISAKSEQAALLQGMPSTMFASCSDQGMQQPRRLDDGGTEDRQGSLTL